MKLILVRHGQATAYCADDAGRDLTEFGCVQAQQTAEYISQHHTVDLIISSPYNRAEQTAKVILAQLATMQPSPKFITLDSITPDDDANVALSNIDRTITTMFGDENKCVVVVCHMPIVAHLTGKILDKEPVSFQLAECRVIDTPTVVAGFGEQLASFVPTQP